MVSHFADDRVNQTKFRSLVKGTFESPTLESPFRYKTAPKVVTKCSDPAPPPLQQDNQPEASTSSTLPDAEYLSRLQHWRDVATLLRQNVVQGEALKQEKARREQEEQAAQAEAAEAEDLEGRAWSELNPLRDSAAIRGEQELTALCVSLYQSFVSLQTRSSATTQQSDHLRSFPQHHSRIEKGTGAEELKRQRVKQQHQRKEPHQRSQQSTMQRMRKQ